MLGYTTRRQAATMGFTHDGRYMGMPVWVDMRDDDCPALAAKWAPLELAFPILDMISGLLWPIAHPGEEPMFAIELRGAL